MAHNHHWLNRTRLNVHLLESRIQPGSWFTTGLVETGLLSQDREPGLGAGLRALGAGVPQLGAGLLTPPQDRPQVSFTQQETFGQSPWHGHETVPQLQPASTLDTMAHPDQLLQAALFADAALADPLGASPRSRPVRQRTDNGVVTRRGESVDASALTTTASTHSRALARASVVRSEAGPPAVPLGLGTDSHTSAESTVSETQKQTIAENYGGLPLSFEQNVGQFDDRVDFVTRTGGMTTFLTATAAVFAVQNSESGSQNPESADWRAGRLNALDASLQGVDTPRSPVIAVYMEIVGANPAGRAAGVNSLPGIVNYFIGNDPSQWHASIATFGRVEYQDVYPGIDLVYYGNNGALEYDFIVAPGADPNVIALNFAGADGVEVDPQGNLVLHTAAGDVVQQKPLTYQQQVGNRQEIASRYVLDGTGVRFEVGAYDSTQPLVIDPLVLGYSTYFVGGTGLAVDSAGNAYVIGGASSTDFPATAGAFDTTYNGGFDTTVAKLNATGSALVYATYLGGSALDAPSGIAVDSVGNAYISGDSKSTDFPTTAGAFDTSHNGDRDVFITKLNAAGSALDYSTYLGGGGTEFANGGIALDSSGNAYVSGFTNSGIPTTAGAFDTTYNGGPNDAFVTKVNAAGSALVYSTYLGGSGDDLGKGIAVDSAGNAYASGSTGGSFPTTAGAFDTSPNGGSTDAFVTKLNAAGSALVYSTYLGGFSSDDASVIAVDSAGNAYVSGDTFDFPTTAGAFDTSYNGGFGDSFVTKLNSAGSALVYSTYLGGNGEDETFGIAVDAAGHAHVVGRTLSNNFPTTACAFDVSYNGSEDAFVTKLSATGAALVDSTYLGGSSFDKAYGIAMDAIANTFVSGSTSSSNFPTTAGAFDTIYDGSGTGFVTKFGKRACRAPVQPSPVVPVP